MNALRFICFLHWVTTTPWFSLLQLDFQHFSHQKWHLEKWRRRRRRRPNNSGTLLQPISQRTQGENIPCGETPHSDNQKLVQIEFSMKIHPKSFNSIGWAGFYSLSLIFLQFCLLNPFFPTRPGIRTPGQSPGHSAGCTHTLWPATHSAWSSHSCHIWAIHFFRRISI